MESGLFTLDGMQFLLRWLHYFFGVMWIGHLYYFNFAQGTAMASADAGAKSGITRFVVPQALYWFRWGAMWTIVTGVLILAIKGHQAGWEVFSSSWGVFILTGAAMGFVMWANVWFVIWPKQKVIIASANQVAGGGAANPAAAALGPQALLASRTNTLLSIPMLFFMGAASHLPLQVTPESNLMVVTVVMGIIILAVEGNALKGQLGPMKTVKGVITSGFVLTAVVYFLLLALV